MYNQLRRFVYIKFRAKIFYGNFRRGEIQLTDYKSLGGVSSRKLSSIAKSPPALAAVGGKSPSCFLHFREWMQLTPQKPRQPLTGLSRLLQMRVAKIAPSSAQRHGGLGHSFYRMRVSKIFVIG